MPDNRVMPNDNAEKRIEAKRLYLEEDLQPIQIAERIGVLAGTIRGWKHKDNWNAESLKRSGGTRARVVPPKPGTAPFQPNNQKATIHGLFARYLPDETRDILQQLEERSAIDVLWDQIKLAYAALLRAQQLMHVRDIKDHTEMRQSWSDSGQGSSESYMIQMSWDKQANFLRAQAQAQASLAKMIAQYDEMLRSELTTEEQRLRVEKIRNDMALDRERFALEQRKAGMGDDIENESGIVLLPAVDESLMDEALPDPGQAEAGV